MSLRALSVLAVLIGSLVATARGDDAKPAADPLAPFARFVGGAWESEGDFRVRIVYEWGLDKKLLKIKSYLHADGAFKLVYESAVYWHPAKKEVVFQSVSGQGGLFEGVMTAEGKTFTSVFTSYEGGKSTPYRQTIEFQDDDTVTWTVFGKKGEEWVVMHSMPEKRVKLGAQ